MSLWRVVVSAGLALINVCRAIMPLMPCTFPTCDLPPPNCRIINDPFGCPTCNFVCEYGPFVCPEIICSNYCRDGYTMDQNGCQNCNCKMPWQPSQPQPPQLECHTWLHCPQGICPMSCSCMPHCNPHEQFPRRGPEREGIYGEEPHEM